MRLVKNLLVRLSFNLSALSLLALLLSGCGLETRFIDPGQLKPPPTITSELKEATIPLIVISFPSQLDVAAAPTVNERFITDYLWLYSDRPGDAAQLRAAGPSRVAETLRRSAYLAAELYGELAPRFPSGSVLLQPKRLTDDGKGRVRLDSPIDLPPTAIEIQCWADVIPSTLGVVRGRTTLYDTFGQDAYLYLTVWGVNPETGNRELIASSEQGLTAPDQALSEVCNNKNYTFVPFARSNLSKADNILALHTFGLVVSEAAVRQDAVRKSGLPIEVSPLGPFWREISIMLVDALNNAHPSKTERLLLARYAHQFDPQLADAMTKSSTLEPALEDRVLIMKDLLSQEKEFLFKQDQQFFDTIYEGEFGQSYRAMRVPEMEFASAQQESAQRAEQAQWMALGMSLTYSAMAANHQITPQQAMTLQLSVFTGAQQAMERESQYAQQLVQLFNNHLSRISETQTEFVIKFGKTERKIRVNSLEKLHTEFKKIYQEEFGIAPIKAVRQ